MLPEYQGKGVGRMLMQAVECYVTQSIPDGRTVSLELISSKGKEPFYEKFGFEHFLLVCEYGEAAANPEIAVYTRR